MPPKRMTANPVRPARYRPGKPLPGQGASHSESEEDDDDEEDGDGEEEEKVEERKEVTKPAVISSSLKNVDLNRHKAGGRTEQTGVSESDDEDASSEGENGTIVKPSVSKDYEEESEEDSSEYSSGESDESEEEEPAPKRGLIRPTFIPKSKRNAQATSGGLEASSATAAVTEEEVAARKAEAQAVVEEQIRKDAQMKSAAKRGWDDDTIYQEPPDDTDDLDPAAERAAWKLRELLRIKRERDAIEQIEKEREEIERRKNMDEAERYKEDMEYTKKQAEEKKEARGQMQFLQKYYHKGAFYQDDSELMSRNYGTAKVEDDVMNREILPKALQVRSMDQLGKRGQTRWTHLAAEDTSNIGKELDNPWFDKKPKFQAIPGMKDERFLPDKLRDKRLGNEGGNSRGGEGAPKDAPSGPRGRDDNNRGQRDDWRDRDDRRRNRYEGGGRDDRRPRRDDDYDDSRRRRDDNRDRHRDRDRDRDRDRYNDRPRNKYDGNGRGHDRERKRGSEEYVGSDKRRKLDD